MKKLTPNLMVKEVKESVEFYKTLGFELLMAVPGTEDGILNEIPGDREIVFAMVKYGTVEIMIQAEKSLKKDIPALEDTTMGASVCLNIELDNVTAYYDIIKEKAEVVKELSRTWYGTDEFYIRDNSGYVLGFYEQKE